MTAKVTTALAAMAIGLTMLSHSVASSESCDTIHQYVHPACDPSKVANPVCGGIGYGNDGAYIVNKVEILVKDTQPSGVTLHPECKSTIDVKYTNNLTVGQCDKFTLPADCTYKLKINIEGGPSKDRSLFLTPGCAIATKTDGTTISNDWHVSESWASDDAKNKVYPNGDAPSHPDDGHGNKCGEEGDI